MSNNIPFIPGTAPFTAAQRAWLNGYFVGLLSTAHAGESPAVPVEVALMAGGFQS